jgi:hypothetical protein
MTMVCFYCIDLLIFVFVFVPVVLTDQVLASNAFVFFIAGFETTSSTMSFLLLELAAHPDIQKRTRDEINEVLSQHNNELSSETIKDLHYLEMVISGKCICFLKLILYLTSNSLHVKYLNM